MDVGVIHYLGQALLQSAADLSCNFESPVCVGWRNGSNGIEDQSDWSTAINGVFLDPWHSIPRPYEGNQFSYVLGGNAAAPQFSWLVSDTIPCLLVPGYLTFHYWKNTFLSGLFRQPLPRLQIFRRQPPTTQNLELIGDFQTSNSWGWRFAAFEVPATDQEFQLVIQAEYQGAFDVVGIDALSFRGVVNPKYCSLAPAEREQLLLATGLASAARQTFIDPSIGNSNTNTIAVLPNTNEPMPQATQPPFASAPNFNVPAPTPAGRNPAPRQPQQPIRTTNALLPSFDTQNSSVVQQTPPQLTQEQIAALIPILQQQLRSGELARLLQNTPALNVANQRTALSTTDLLAAASRSNDLQLLGDQRSSSFGAALPVTSKTVTQTQSAWPQVLFQETRPPQQPSFRTAATHAPTPPPTSPTSTSATDDYDTQALSITDRQLCPQVNCGFENNPCEYEGTDDQLGAWVIVQGRIGNPITGITRAAFGRFYSVAYTNKGTSTQVLRSSQFSTTQQTFLTFWYYFANADDARLVVCDVRLDNCFWEKTKESVRPDSRRWRRGAVVLPPGEHQVMFVVEQLGDNYYVGIDEIYLRTQVNGPLADCV